MQDCISKIIYQTMNKEQRRKSRAERQRWKEAFEPIMEEARKEDAKRAKLQKQRKQQ